jgi:hypothetical protein
MSEENDFKPTKVIKKYPLIPIEKWREEAEKDNNLFKTLDIDPKTVKIRKRGRPSKK